MPRKPVQVYVAGARPNVQAALVRAVALWNEAVQATVLEIVPDGTPGAVPIRLANQRNQWWAGAFAPDEEAEYTGMTQGKRGMVRGTVPALLDETNLTLAHELGHALGLYHPYPTSTPRRYIPATDARVMRDYPKPISWRVAPIGLMGNEMNPNDPDFRGQGPSRGEVHYLRRLIGYEPLQHKAMEVFARRTTAGRAAAALREKAAQTAEPEPASKQLR